MHIPFLERVSFHLSHHSKSLYRLLLRLSFSFLMSVLPKSLFSFSESSEKSKADIALEICVRNRQLENGGELTGTTVIGGFFFLQINLLVWRRLLSQLVFRGLFCLRLGAPWYLLLLSHCWLTWHSTCVGDLRGPGVWTEVGRESLGYQLKTGKTCCRLYLIYDNHTSFCSTHQYSYTI